MRGRFLYAGALLAPEDVKEMQIALAEGSEALIVYVSASLLKPALKNHILTNVGIGA